MAKEKCRHREIQVSWVMVRCTSCGKVWLRDKNDFYKDMSFRAGGQPEGI